MQIHRHTDHRSHSFYFASGSCCRRTFGAIHIQWKTHNDRFGLFLAHKTF
jgi:hypothetical protein